MPKYVVSISLGTWDVEVEADTPGGAWNEAYGAWDESSDDVFVTATSEVREVSE